MANNSRLWSSEYKQKGIPSSSRQKPSGITKLLQKSQIKGKTAADLGCGKGRNTFWLVENGAKKVYAIDFVKEVIDEIKSQNNPKITAICHDLTTPWPIPNNSLDLIIDIFCFKHQTNKKDSFFYKSEINRTLKHSGLLLLDLAAEDDEFYGVQNRVEINKDVYKIVDPFTKVPSLLFNKKSLLAEFPNFKVIKFRNNKKKSKMHGKLYLRSTLKFLLKRI
jgi:SAM-dependent methyltransferase